MRLDPHARGTVYLVHFSGHTSQNRQHYLGWSADIGRRFTEHTSGWGSHETRKGPRGGPQGQARPDLEWNAGPGAADQGVEQRWSPRIRRALPVLRQGHEAA
jgi:hypothetical protein